MIRFTTAMATKYLFCCVLCLFIHHGSVGGKLTNSIKYPIVIVPGDGGSQFEAKLDKPSVVHRWCSQKTDWFPFWLNLELMTPFAVECFADNMRLVYDRETHSSHNSPGVQTRQLGFGNSSTIEWLDASHFPKTEYFYDIVEDLVKNLGYVRNVSIRGAPYDFRKAANEMPEYLDMLRKLIEDTHYKNNGQKVVLLGHSMGNLYMAYLLYHQSQAWKDKYIQSMITLAGPWGGAAKVLRLMASGDDLGVWLIINPSKARLEQRSMSSSAWLLPYDTFWNDTEVLVRSPTANYTVKDYERFFKDINFTDGFLMRQDTEPLIKSLQPPNVEVHCLHGYAVDTPASFTYSASQWYDKQPDVTYGDGDGTVNMRSLHGCLRWVGKQKQKVHHQAFKGAEHMTILHDGDVLAYIRQVLQ